MISLEQARAMDAADPLRACHERFVLPEGLIYLDGNSLGALPKAAIGRKREVIEREWGASLIRSWNNHGGIAAPQRVRSEARSVGKECGSRCTSRWTRYNRKKTIDT